MHISKFCGFLIIFIASIPKDVFCVKIINFNVPKYHLIENAANPERVILECKYKIHSNETGFVLKWFWNNHQIYQWIPQRIPYVPHYMKNKIDINYEASDDKNYQYGSLALINPNWNTTGEYKCTVQTFESSDIQAGFLQIIDFSHIEWHISHKIIQDEFHVTCSVKNVYPQPKLSISLKDGDFIPIKSENVERDSDGLFDVSVNTSLKNDGIALDTEFICTLNIPSTEYTLEKFLSYSGSNSMNKLNGWILLTSALTILLSSMLNKSII